MWARHWGMGETQCRDSRTGMDWVKCSKMDMGAGTTGLAQPMGETIILKGLYWKSIKICKGIRHVSSTQITMAVNAMVTYRSRGGERNPGFSLATVSRPILLPARCHNSQKAGPMKRMVWVEIKENKGTVIVTWLLRSRHV